MTIQHVHVAEGGQAIVGNVSAPAEGVGVRKKSKDQPHALVGAEQLQHLQNSGRWPEPARSKSSELFLQPQSAFEAT
jgi:hypothetical protein